MEQGQPLLIVSRASPLCESVYEFVKHSNTDIPFYEIRSREDGERISRRYPGVAVPSIIDGNEIIKGTKSVIRFLGTYSSRKMASTMSRSEPIRKSKSEPIESIMEIEEEPQEERKKKKKNKSKKSKKKEIQEEPSEETVFEFIEEPLVIEAPPAIVPSGRTGGGYKRGVPTPSISGDNVAEMAKMMAEQGRRYGYDEH
jgi:hypothetical protein